MIYTTEVENMCPVAKGAKHEPAPIPEEMCIRDRYDSWRSRSGCDGAGNCRK